MRLLHISKSLSLVHDHEHSKSAIIVRYFDATANYLFWTAKATDSPDRRRDQSSHPDEPTQTRNAAYVSRATKLFDVSSQTVNIPNPKLVLFAWLCRRSSSYMPALSP